MHTPDRQAAGPAAAEHHKAVGKSDKEILADTYTDINPAVQRQTHALTDELLHTPTAPNWHACATRMRPNVRLWALANGDGDPEVVVDVAATRGYGHPTKQQLD